MGHWPRSVSSHDGRFFERLGCDGLLKEFGCGTGCQQEGVTGPRAFREIVGGNGTRHHIGWIHSLEVMRTTFIIDPTEQERIGAAVAKGHAEGLGVFSIGDRFEILRLESLGSRIGLP
jgi:hypothetical protein